MIPTAFAALYSWRFATLLRRAGRKARGVQRKMQDIKKGLRGRAAAVRKAAYEAHGTDASRMLAAHGLDFLKVPPGTIVSGFAAIRDEINPADLMSWLHAEGFRLALPVMVGKDKPLLMRAWSPGDVMEAAAWGIAEPMADKPEVEPDVVLVPRRPSGS